MITLSDYSIIPELRAMLGYCRPHGSAMEAAFIRKYLRPLGATADEYGNYHLAVPNPDGSPSRTMWSSHTDTVHRTSAQQGVVYNAETGLLHLSRRSAKRSGCLGADDTVGVFLMRRMVLANRPGYYVWHYGEECGCVGSRDLADARGDWLAESFDHAIAFDRKDMADVITYQMGERTASDLFACELAARLNQTSGLGYRPCNGGAYTDTNSYEHLIAECSNLSIGYDGNHSHRETVDAAHVDRLLAALLVLDAATLPAVRNPATVDSLYRSYALPTRAPGLVIDMSDRVSQADLARYRPSRVDPIDLDCRLYPYDYVDPAWADLDPDEDDCCVDCGAPSDYRIGPSKYAPQVTPFCAKCGSDWF